MPRGTGVSPVISFNPNHGRDARATSYQLSRLKRELKPFKLHWYPTLGSTNTKAIQLRRAKKLFAPACIITGHQTAGRGRGTNRWHSPRGVITVTFVVPIHENIHPHHIPLIAGLAVRDACASLGASEVGVKWPNDLCHRDLKLAGLLCERVENVDLIGVGLNVNPALNDLPGSLRGKVTSLAAITSIPVDLTGALIAIARALDRALIDGQDASIASLLHRYASHLVLTGRRVRVSDNGEVIEGICDGIDRTGRLLVMQGSGKRAVVSGNVRVV